MDRRLDRRVEAAASLAETLGLETEAEKAIVLGGLGLHGDMKAAGEAGKAHEDPLADFLIAAALKVRALAESERRSRQTANGIRASGFTFASSLDPAAILEALLDYLNWLVPYAGASVLIIGRSGGLEVGAAREWRRSSSRGPTAPELALAQEAIDAGESRQCLVGVVRCLILPLLGPSGPVGAVLLVRDGADLYDEEQTRAADAFAGQAAAAVRNATLYEDLCRARDELVSSYDTSIEVLSRALDLRDHETEGHSRRVASLAVRLGAALGLEGASLENLRRGALLHDVGKIGIPDTILLKPGPLDADEFKVMQRHPALAKELLANSSFIANAIEVPYSHHERWDGRGYPIGLESGAIPLAARIFSVVDVWDALVHDRPYRKAMGLAEARRYLATLGGTQLDPFALDAFLELEAGPSTRNTDLGFGP